MSSRPLFAIGFCLVSSAPVAGAENAQPAADRPPNIILVTADHMGTIHIGANGSPHMRTPNMDRLADEGVSFTRFYTVGVACMPNRASLFTGRYPHSHGVMSNGIPLPETEITLTHVLAEAGYETGQMGKLHFWPHSRRNHRGPHPAYGFHEMRLSDEPGVSALVF